MSIEFTELPEDGRKKYGPMLDNVKRIQLEDPKQRDRWTILTVFTRELSARDAAHRLKGQYPEFEFKSRKGLDSTAVYCRLKEDINE